MKMKKFNLRKVKPKLYNLTALSIVTLILIVLMDVCSFYTPLLFGILICVYLLAALIMLVKALKGQLEYNPYSYNTIIYSGFSLFLLFVLAGELLVLYEIVAFPLSGIREMSQQVSSLLANSKLFMILSFPLILIFAIGLCTSNIALIRHEGFRFTNLLGVILAFVLVAGDLTLFFGDYYTTGSMMEVMIHDMCVNLYAAIYLYFECMMIGTIYASLHVLKLRPEKNQDYIIVLGCGLRPDGTPTPLLAGRINKALEFYREQIEAGGKAPVFITSGGQGGDEAVAESTAMKNYLIEQGIPESQIIEENKSTTTYENMLFSKKIIDAANPEANVIFSTTKYHVFRSGIKARRVKLQATGIGSKTKWYFWPNAWVREFAGLLSEHRLKQAFIIIGMLVLYIVTTLVTFLHY